MKKYLCYRCGKERKNRRKEPTLCLSCYNELRPSGENHPRWKGAGICPKCGGKKTADNNHAKFCRNCNEHKGEKHWNFGRHLSDEVKMKISLSNTGKRVGEENHMFNSEKEIRRTYRFPYRLWRKKVLERDNNTCQICKAENTNIVHHINPYKDNPESLDINNGITLCYNCHLKTIGKEHTFVELFQETIKKKVNSVEAQNG